MIKTGLVYIYSSPPARDFVGCGALVEGGYIATCRHVWRDAIVTESEELSESPYVEIEFPFGNKEKVSEGNKFDAPRRRAKLADACGESEDPAPDLVLLSLVEPLAMPSGVMRLQISVRERFEIGGSQVHTYLVSRGRYGTIAGTIDDEAGPDGLRQFTGDKSQAYSFEEGSSGSPVFCHGGQQLAGIISLAETGANEGKTHLHVGFVVPGTTIYKYLAGRLAADQQAAKRGIDPDILKPILAKLGEQNVPDAEIAERLDASIEAILAQSEEPVPVSNDGVDVDATIAASREKLGALDTAGALDVLQPKIAEVTEEVEVQMHRLVPLLKERAAVERLAFDYHAAKQSLAEVTRLRPDDVWAFIDLGDLYVTTGPLEDAAKAFRNAEVAARRQGLERDLAAALSRLGGVQVAQGNLPGALKSYSDSLAIADRLAKSDSGNVGWQRDLSVSYNKVGGVQEAQNNLAGALKSYQADLAIADRLATSDPSNADWQRDLSVSYDKVGGVQEAQGNPAGALKSYSDSLAIRDRLAKSAPGNAGWQRDLSVSYNKVGDVQEAQGDLKGALKSYSDGLAIMESLARSAPGNAGWQRDLSVSYDNVGGVQVAQDNLAGALKSYSDSLAIRDRLAKSDPGNAGWQRDLSASYANLANVHRQSGDKAKARGFLRQGREIMVRLTKLSPDNSVWKNDLAWFDRQIKALGP